MLKVQFLAQCLVQTSCALKVQGLLCNVSLRQATTARVLPRLWTIKETKATTHYIVGSPSNIIIGGVNNKRETEDRK